ncbi:hypothetical protein Ancab_008373 [Ancistrocladus abbreviatus]
MWKRYKIRLMGGRKVLITTPGDTNMEGRESEIHNRLGRWFNSIWPRTKTEVGLDRVTWIRCMEIPLHAWKEDVFVKIAKCWGDLLEIDDDTRTGNG